MDIDDGMDLEFICNTRVLLSLGRYLCWWTINPRGYHPPSSQCFGTDVVY